MNRAVQERRIRDLPRLGRLIVVVSQPATVKQLARALNLTLDACGAVVGRLADMCLLQCLNAAARRSRVYWLTSQGAACQRHLFRDSELAPHKFDFPCVDWELYGWVCFTHRTAIIKALSQPLQPSAIKRKARSADPTLRMSANNVRDVIRLFRAKQIVTPIRERRSAYPLYQLTETGQNLRTLLIRADAMSWNGRLPLPHAANQ